MTASTERAIFAGGCFWGMQDLLRRYPGVISTRVGYTGGDVPNATYRKHGTHAEAATNVISSALIGRDETQADMNLRGKFTTGAEGHFLFRSIKPGPYPVPTDGPVGELLRGQERHPYRPAHLHFLGFKPGFKTLITQVFVDDDCYLESDVAPGSPLHTRSSWSPATPFCATPPIK